MLVYQRVNTVLNIVLNLLEGLLRIWDIWLKVNRGLHLCLGFPMLRNHRPCGSVDSGTSYLSHLPCSSVVQAFYPTITTYIIYIYHIISYHMLHHFTTISKMGFDPLMHRLKWVDDPKENNKITSTWKCSSSELSG